MVEALQDFFLKVGQYAFMVNTHNFTVDNKRDPNEKTKPKQSKERDHHLIRSVTKRHNSLILKLTKSI